MSKLPLTPKQHKVLKFLKSYFDKNEYMPSYREIADALDIKSTNSVFELLNRLVVKGHIKKVTNEGCVSRAIELINP